MALQLLTVIEFDSISMTQIGARYTNNLDATICLFSEFGYGF